MKASTFTFLLRVVKTLETSYSQRTRRYGRKCLETSKVTHERCTVAVSVFLSLLIMFCRYVLPGGDAIQQKRTLKPEKMIWLGLKGSWLKLRPMTSGLVSRHDGRPFGGGSSECFCCLVGHGGRKDARVVIHFRYFLNLVWIFETMLGVFIILFQRSQVALNSGDC